MDKSWRCRLRLHRWQRLRGPDGQWYRECRDCGTELIDRYKEGPRPPRSADPAILESLPRHAAALVARRLSRHTGGDGSLVASRRHRRP
jgi:hypothetical protein